MEAIRRIIDWLLLGWAPPAVGLTVVAAAVGVGMLWVFRKTSDQRGIRAVKRQIHASWLELRVYADEPAVGWRAQKSLLRANLRYMGLALKPTLWMLVPVGLLLIYLDAFYGRAPLPLGREAVVTMRMADSWNPQSPAPELAAPAGIAVEGPPVRVVDAKEVSWRIRPSAECSGQLRFIVDGREVTRPIEAGGRPRYVAGNSSGIDVRYPEGSLQVFGLGVNWLVWFFVVSMAAAFLFRRRLGVVL